MAKRLTIRKRTSQIIRFFSYFIVPQDYKTEYWEWVGAKNDFGYGLIMRDDGSNLLSRAHRLAWEYWNNKKIPDGLFILHECDNPSCVNPYHLSIGTHQENMKSMKKRERSQKCCGEKNSVSKLTNEEVLKIRRIRETQKLTYKEIGDLFNVSKGCVGSIINKRVWKHI
ncbi:MAG TPA: HNH endonuclease [Desulfobacter sp.]|nr:HNH endonuclease [Desulfobacter sp.]